MRMHELAIFLSFTVIGLAWSPGGASAQAATEHDFFPDVCAQLTLTPLRGEPEVVTATGPLAIDVFLLSDEGGASDTDGDGLDQVPIRIVDLALVGTSPTLGPFQVDLAAAPTSEGEIEETANNTPFVLDLPPFTATGQAHQVFDLYFEIQVDGSTLHNTAARHFVGTIDHKPPAEVAFLSSGATTALLDANGNTSGLTLTSFQLGCGATQTLGFVLSCFYECREANRGRQWTEVTTLMVANPTGRSIEATLAYLDGNEQFVAQSPLELSSGDLDEINVCRSLEAGHVDVPSAGLLELVVLDQAPVPGTVQAWVKNLLGRFPDRANDPLAGAVVGIAKTQCQAVPPEAATVDGALARLAHSQPPVVEPVLIEGTGDDRRSP
jgi:hypothetical protein